jgi:REP element-mobilizing transposase RayT
MPGTFHNLKFHLVFSTAGRERWLAPEIRARVHDYLGGIVRGEGGVSLQIGGVEDHVHVLFGWKTDRAISDLVRNVKAHSSRWIHETWPELAKFHWQEGYSIFSVSESQMAKVRGYIERQEDHHRTKTFAEELEEFLRVNGVEYDPRYLLG